MYDLLRQLPGFTVKGIEMNSYLEEVKATALAEAQKNLYGQGIWLDGWWAYGNGIGWRFCCK